MEITVKPHTQTSPRAQSAKLADTPAFGSRENRFTSIYARGNQVSFGMPVVKNPEIQEMLKLNKALREDPDLKALHDEIFGGNFESGIEGFNELCETVNNKENLQLLLRKVDDDKNTALNIAIVNAPKIVQTVIDAADDQTLYKMVINSFPNLSNDSNSDNKPVKEAVERLAFNSKDITHEQAITLLCRTPDFVIPKAQKSKYIHELKIDQASVSEATE